MNFNKNCLWETVEMCYANEPQLRIIIICVCGSAQLSLKRAINDPQSALAGTSNRM